MFWSGLVRIGAVWLVGVLNRDCVLRGCAFRRRMMDLLREIGDVKWHVCYGDRHSFVVCAAPLLVVQSSPEMSGLLLFSGSFSKIPARLRPSAGPSFLSSSHGRRGLHWECSAQPNNVSLFPRGDAIVYNCRGSRDEWRSAGGKPSRGIAAHQPRTGTLASVRPRLGHARS